MSAPALIADIGATNARFALLGPDGHYASAILLCVDFAMLEDAVRAFLDRSGASERPNRAAFAIAGPVTGDRLRMTNHPWEFSIAETKRRLGLDRLEVVNDFAAVAHAVPRLAEGDRVQAGGGAPVPHQPIGVIGPGTGLGMASLAWCGGRWQVLAGEGGHATAAPWDEREAAIIAILRKRLDHVSVERLISGMGLRNLRQALAELDGVAAESMTPAEISAAGLSGSDRLCAEAVELFCALLGGAAGNLALTVGARGGIYIAGGIVPKLGDAFFRSRFRERFVAKGRMSAFLEPIPTYVITHQLPAFLGLAALLEED
jgi:glucokinase